MRTLFGLEPLYFWLTRFPLSIIFFLSMEPLMTWTFTVMVAGIILKSLSCFWEKSDLFLWKMQNEKAVTYN